MDQVLLWFRCCVHCPISLFHIAIVFVEVMHEIVVLAVWGLSVMVLIGNLCKY